MRQGTIQTMHAKRGCGFLGDTEGAEVLFYCSVLTPAERCATLEVGMCVEFDPASSPKGPRAAKIPVTPLEMPPALSFEELAASFQRHAAG